MAVSTISLVDRAPDNAGATGTLSSVTSDFFKFGWNGTRFEHAATGLRVESSDLSVSPFMLGLVSRLSKRVDSTQETTATQLDDFALRVNSSSESQLVGALARLSNFVGLISRAAPIVDDGQVKYWFPRQYASITSTEAGLIAAASAIPSDIGLIQADTSAEMVATLSHDSASLTTWFPNPMQRFS